MLATWSVVGIAQEAPGPTRPHETDPCAAAPASPMAAETGESGSGLAAAQAQPPRTRREVLRRRREAKQVRLSPYVVSRLERRVRRLETWRFARRLFAKGVAGFRPVVGGMPSGSGFVTGAGYIAGPASDVLQATASARYSTRGFQAYDAELRLFPEEHAGGPVTGRLKAHLHEFGSLRHFGLGGDTRRSDRSFYRLTERVLEAAAGARLGPFVRLEGRLRRLTAEAEPGSRGASLATSFEPWDIPGFGTVTDFAVYGGQLAVTLRNRDVTPHVGVALTAAVERYDDRSRDRFDFTRMVAEAQVHVPLGRRNRLLAFRARTSHAAGAPPFYLMEALGGADTLRGFREYRFRDARNLLLNVEYRWEVWTHTDFTLFGDFGKVFPDASGMSFRNLKAGYGFGIRSHAPGGTVVRLDFAWSREGFRLHVGSGPSF